jgi:hypothetical protein
MEQEEEVLLESLWDEINAEAFSVELQGQQSAAHKLFQGHTWKAK